MRPLVDAALTGEELGLATFACQELSGGLGRLRVQAVD